MRKYYLSIFFLISSSVFGQENKFHSHFKHLTTDDGLSSNTVKCILQGKDAFIWLGTANGLNRYDGRQFMIYKNVHGDTATLADNDIYCMAEDDSGFLWMGHRGAGISVFNPAAHKVIRYKNNKNDNTSLNSDDVRAICMDKDGEIWIGTGKGLNKYISGTGTFVNYDKMANTPQNIFALYVDHDGIIWIGSHNYGATGGLFRLNKKTGEFKQYYPITGNPNSLSYPHVVAISEDKNGYLWIGTRHGLDVFNPVTESFTLYQDEQVEKNFVLRQDIFRSQIFTDRDGNVWVGTATNGLNLFNRATGKFIRFTNNPNSPVSISSNEIRSICEDKSDQIWIGTTNGGVNIYDRKQNQFSVYQPVPDVPGSLCGKKVTAIYEDRNSNLWAAVYTKGIDRLDRNEDKFYHYQSEPGNKFSLASNDVTGICEDGKGALWVSSFTGSLCTLDTRHDNFNISRGSFFINGLYCDRNGFLWIIPNQSNLIRYDPYTNKDTVFEADKEGRDPTKLVWGSVTSLCEDSAGTLWIGTIRGLSAYNAENQRFRNYKNNPEDSTSLSSNIITALLYSRKGNLWVATTEALDVYDPITGKFRHYRINAGEVAVFAEDSTGNFWLGTNNGLIKFNPEKGLKEIYSTDDGLPDREFTGAFCKSRNGKFYFGTINGFFSFNPAAVAPNPYIPEVSITKFTVLNKPWQLTGDLAFTKEVTLSYREYFFTVEFSALEFPASEKNQYTYRLEGFNKEWVFLGNRREVTFTNLDAGSYSLKVKASNNHGLWSDEKEILKIIITPPWWKTKTFYASCIVVLILIIYGYIKWRERKLRQEKKLLETKVNDATAKIRLQKEIIEEKNRNITDSIEYAKIIQEAILPPMDELKKISNESFIFHRQRDIIGGDFYFITEVNGWKILALADCTGHGVPGALMSMLGKDMLNEIVNDKKITLAGEVLDILSERVTDALNPDKTAKVIVQDGMDACFIAIHENDMQYAGAKRPLIICNNGNLNEYPADDRNIGGERMTAVKFRTNRLRIEKGMMLYLFTDGFADQFGGERQKKFKTKNLKQLFSEIADKPVHEQKILVEKTFNEWKGEYEQTDDVTVIGIRV